MHRTFARIRVFKLAAASSVLSVAAVATATPTGIHSPSEAAIVAAVEHGLQTNQAREGSISIAEPVEAVAIKRVVEPKLAVVRHRSYGKVEDLPFSGQLAALDLTGPHDPTLTPLEFEPREASPAAVEQVAYTVFSKPLVAEPAPIIAANVPQPRPAVQRPATEGGIDVSTSRVLAYAAEPEGLDAPFDALMGGLRKDDTAEADGHFRPRPRPGQAVVTAWLDGRNIYQFSADHHDWVANPLPANAYDAKQQKCLAEGVYFEARGESQTGQAGVAQVILNRVRNPAYPATICGVVYQNKTWRNRCQFSFACDGKAERILSPKAWRTAKRIAKDVTDGKIWLKDVGDSTHYHAGYVSPRWGRTMIKVDRIGAHIFYRTRYGGWS